MYDEARIYLNIKQNFLFQLAGCPIKIEVLNDFWKKLKGEITGPPETPYEGGKFILDIEIPESYPFDPPKVYQTYIANSICDSNGPTNLQFYILYRFMFSKLIFNLHTYDMSQHSVYTEWKQLTTTSILYYLLSIYVRILMCIDC